MRSDDERNNSSLKKEASLLTISKMTNLVITMVTSMLLSRFRTIEEYGTYSQISLTINLVTTLVILGLPNAINFFLPRIDTDQERCEFIQTFFSVNTIMSIVAGVVMIICMPLMVAYFANKGLYQFMYFAAFMPWAKITIQERSNLFVAAQKTKLLIAHTLTNSIALLGIILLTRVCNQSFQFYMVLYVIVELAFSVIVYFEAKKISGSIALKINKEWLKRILIFSIPIGVSDMVNTISREIDKLMIGGFLDTESLAIYTNSAREIALTVISTSFIAVLMPKLSRLIKHNKKNDAVLIWKSTTAFTYIFMCFGVCALVVFAPQVMTILYSKKYLLGTGVFRIYSLILLWRTAYFGTMLSLHGQTKKILYCSVVSMCLNVILNYTLFHIIGFTGPAWGTFISIGVVNILQLKLSANILKMKIIEIFPWKELFKISIMNISLSLIVCVIIKWLNIGTDARSCIVAIVIGSIWMGIYFGIIMRKKIIKQWKEN